MGRDDALDEYGIEVFSCQVSRRQPWNRERLDENL